MNQQETVYNQMLDIVNRDPDSYVTLQIPIFNCDKGTTNSTSAYDIFKQVELQMGDSVQIIKVEYAQKEQQIPTFNPDPEHNKFTKNRFIIQLFGLDENPNILIDGEEEIEEVDMEEENGDQPPNEQYIQISKILDAIFELHFEKIKPQVLQELLTHSLQKPEGKLQLTLRMKVKYIKNYHDVQVKLHMGEKLPPLFVRAGEGREIKRNDQIQQRLKEKRMNIQSVSLGLFNHKENQEGEINIYQYQEYFNSLRLDSYLENNFVQQYAFFIDDQLEPPQLEIFIEFGRYFILKIQINLIYVQFGIFEDMQMYLKLLTPPQYYVSLISKEKYEKPQLKKDWIRIDNFIINQLFSKNIISDILRLILINNTVVNIKFTERSDLSIKVMHKLKTAYGIFNQNNKILIKSVQPKLDDIDEQTYTKQFKSLKFDIAYNILTTISLNQLNRFYEIQSLIKYLIKEITVSDDKKHKIKVIHQAFFIFNQTSPNLNRYTDQITYNKAAFDKFRKALKQAQQETILEQYTNLQLIYMRKVSLTPSGFVYFPKMPEETSAIVRLRINQMESFIRVHFEDENQTKSNKIPYVTDMFYKNSVNPLKIFDRKYILFTWSSSQLRSGSCWFFDPQSSKMTRRQLIESIGDFSNLKYEQVAKNAARLGQNLSSSKTVKLPGLPKVNTSDDLKDENNQLYTDGIGKISKDFIEYIKSQYHDNSIRAVQVRFEGAKGVLALNVDLPESTIELRLSMVKYKPVQNSYKSGIEILDYNKFRGGFLNRQIIILLKTLGVEDQVFQELQDEYLQKIQDIQLIDSSIYNYFSADYDIAQSDLNIINIIRDLMNAGQNQTNNILIDGIINRLRRRGLMILRTKTNILVEKAARVLGIVDEHSILKAGEIYLNVSKTNKIIDGVNISGQILVTRNPCLHPGDIRVLEGVTNQEIYERHKFNPYEEFTNCIVFPQQGPSIPPQIAGGDLDGDIYFVSWNQKLIPPKIQDPMKYDQPVGKQREVKFKERNKMFHENDQENFFPIDKMIDFLFTYINSDVLGKIDNSHLAFADRSPKMANDEICLLLSELHSKAVDFVKHGEQVPLDASLIAKEWPDYMEKTKDTYISPTIIGQLYRQVVDLCKSEQDKLPPWLKGFNVTGLPNIQIRFIKGFDEINFQGEHHQIQEEQLNEADINEDQKAEIQKWIQKRLKYFEAAIIIIQFMFQQIKALMYLYDIKHEYEVYSGNFTNYTKGDGLYRKNKVNVDNIQKRIICALISLRNQSHQKVEAFSKQLADNEGYETYEIVSAIHLILSYSPESHRYNLKSNLGCLLYILFQRLKENGNFKALNDRYILWYRGASWYFFHSEILNIEKKAQIEELV